MMATKNSIKNNLTPIKKVLQFGRGKKFNYNKQTTIIDTIENQAIAHPNSIAIRFERKKLTYKQLNTKINQLTHYLIKRNLKPHTNVAIYFEPSLELVISILAVLKAALLCST